MLTDGLLLVIATFGIFFILLYRITSQLRVGDTEDDIKSNVWNNRYLLLLKVTIFGLIAFIIKLSFF